MSYIIQSDCLHIQSCNWMYIYNFQHLLIRAEVIMLLFEGWYSGVAGYAPTRLSAYGISDTPKLKISMTHLMRLHRGQT